MHSANEREICDIVLNVQNRENWLSFKYVTYFSFRYPAYVNKRMDHKRINQKSATSTPTPANELDTYMPDGDTFFHFFLHANVKILKHGLDLLFYVLTFKYLLIINNIVIAIRSTRLT